MSHLLDTGIANYSTIPIVQQEIEKKFLPASLRLLPKLDPREGINILQFYFSSKHIRVRGNRLYYKENPEPLLILNNSDLEQANFFLSLCPKVRIRIIQRGALQEAFLTMKLKQDDADLDHTAINNLEFEIPISIKAAEKILYLRRDKTNNIIAKTRYLIKRNCPSQIHNPVTPKPFEIDIFHSQVHFLPTPGYKIADNLGLILIELEKVKDEIIVVSDLPPWVGQDVSTDKRYRSSKLSENPFNKWPYSERPNVLKGKKARKFIEQYS
jgi:CYTH domain-containing protein